MQPPVDQVDCPLPCAIDHVKSPCARLQQRPDDAPGGAPRPHDQNIRVRRNDAKPRQVVNEPWAVRIAPMQRAFVDPQGVHGLSLLCARAQVLLRELPGLQLEWHGHVQAAPAPGKEIRDG